MNRKVVRIVLAVAWGLLAVLPAGGEQHRSRGSLVVNLIRGGEGLSSDYESAPVERSGQYLCFDAVGDQVDCWRTGQDGEFRAGMEWPVPRFVDQGDGTIADELTGLEWLKDAGCLGGELWSAGLTLIGNLNGGTDFSCTEYSPGTRNDWRIPNFKELLSLVDDHEVGPVLISGHPFVNVKSSYYWSSTSFVGSPDLAFVDDLANGTSEPSAKVNSWSIWAVRGGDLEASTAPVEKTGQSSCFDASGATVTCAGTGQDGETQPGVAWPSPRFVDSGDGTVLDRLTGAEWLKDASCLGVSSWEATLSAVTDLNSGTDFSCTDYMAGDFSDWRLPNSHELISLIDYGRSSPALPSGHPFANVQNDIYWSSTTFGMIPDWALYLDLDSGRVEGLAKMSTAAGWAVRGGLLTMGDEALDVSFGDQGIVKTDFASGSGDSGSDAVIQPDGKIVVVGGFSDPVSFADDFALARYKSDGSLDSSFGTGGLVTTDVESDSIDSAFGVALQVDGKIVVTGFHMWGPPYVRDIALLRYNPDGSLDSTFGAGGITVTDIGDGETAFGVTVQADGKIVLTGRLGTTDIDILVVRFESSGTLDLGFGTGGVVVTDIGGGFDSAAGAAALRGDGRILVAGRTGATSSGPSDIVVAQYLPDGTLDNSFGTGGIATAEFASGSDDRLGDGPTIQPDGLILVNGYSTTPTDTDFALARFTAAGALDPTFGSGGVVVIGLGSDDVLQGTPVLDTDGKIVVTGFTGYLSSGGFLAGNLAAARFWPDGTLHRSFGDDGFVVLDLGPGTPDFGRQALIQADGKVLLIGQAADRNGDLGLARVLAYVVVHANSFESGDLSGWISVP